MKRRSVLVCAVLALIATLPPALGADEAVFVLRPYIWAPSIKGDVGISEAPIGDITVPVDEAFLDYAGNLGGALLLTAEARKGRWALVADGIWMRLEDDTGTPGPFLSVVDVQMDTVLLSLAPAYRVLQSDRVNVDVLAGGRYVYIRQDMDLKPDYAAVDSISEQVVDTAADKLSGAVGNAVNKAKDEISGAIRPGDSAADQVQDAINDISVGGDADALIDAILAGGGGYEGGSLVSEVQRYVEAVQNAVAERAADLVDDLSPIERQNPELVEAAIAKAASESVDQLKKNVSSGASKAISQAESALAVKVEGGMNEAASADAVESRDWVDPFFGAKGHVKLMDRLALMFYGDIGGFGVGSELTWQLFGGLSWQASESVRVEAGYRHLDIDYDHDHFIFDASMSGFAAGASIRL